MAVATTIRNDYDTENARQLCYRLMPENWRALRLVLCLEFGERSAYYYYTPHPRKHHRTQHPPAFPVFSGTHSEASEGFFRNPRRGTPDVGVGWVFDPNSIGRHGGPKLLGWLRPALAPRNTIPRTAT